MSKEYELYRTAWDSNKPDWVREKALKGLGSLKTDEAYEYLGKLARDSDKPDWLRSKALDYLSQK